MEASAAPIAFSYAPLKAGEIRLMRLLGYNDRHVCCLMQQFALSHTPSFTALSYTWDAQPRYRPLQVQGRRLDITPNLEAYLREVQDREEAGEPPRWRWIDAVSVNQLDSEERRDQVSQMREIYERAERIEVWLGPAKPSTRFTFEQIDRLTKLDERHVLSGLLPGYHEPLNRDPKISLQDSKILRGLEDMLDHSYWQRSWVLQEVTSPKAREDLVICCGNNRVFWKDFITICGFFKSRSLPVDSPTMGQLNALYDGSMRTLQYISEKRRESKGFRPIHTYAVLSRIRYSRASDPRDLLYAPLQLTDDAGIIPADYSVSARTVYTQFAAAMIRKHDNLEILGCVRAQNDFELPSWVPDWTSGDPHHPLEGKLQLSRLTNERTFDADAGVVREIFVDEHTGGLTVHGFFIGTARTNDKDGQNAYIDIKIGNNSAATRRAGGHTHREFHHIDRDLKVKREHPAVLVNPELVTTEPAPCYVIFGSRYPVILQALGYNRWRMLGVAVVAEFMHGRGLLELIYTILKTIHAIHRLRGAEDFLDRLWKTIGSLDGDSPIDGPSVERELEKLGLQLDDFTQTLEII